MTTEIHNILITMVIVKLHFVTKKLSKTYCSLPVRKLLKYHSKHNFLLFLLKEALSALTYFLSSEICKKVVFAILTRN